MMRTMRRSAPLAVALGAVLLTGSAGCAAVLDEVGGVYNGSSAITGEIRSVDARRGRLELRENSGRNHTLRFDNQTRVVNGQRAASATSLERGDVVQVRVSYDRSGTAWADRIDVRRSARDGRIGSVRTQRLSGVVAAVDTRRGWFTLEQGRNRYTVQLPPRVSRDDARRFERLRRGDRVNVEVRALQRNGYELVRFR